MTYFLNAIIDYGSMCINARTSIGLLNETHVEDEMQSTLLEKSCGMTTKNILCYESACSAIITRPPLPPTKKNKKCRILKTILVSH